LICGTPSDFRPRLALVRKMLAVGYAQMGEIGFYCLLLEFPIRAGHTEKSFDIRPPFQLKAHLAA
jgi:hypothetical protein